MSVRSHDQTTSNPARAAAWTRTLALATLCVVLASTLGAFEVRAQENQAGSSAAERPRVPKVSIDGPPKRIEGKIMRSSRGKKGPVRLLVERKDAEPVTVLVAPEDVCDRLGLSLKADEHVVVEGAMLKSDRPILVASSFVVDGKTIRVRDEQGKILDPAGLAKPAEGTGAAVTGRSKQPEPSPAP
ncbi:MAG: hypothetical protein FJ148_07090 [Deltaproteobacteria bacterium]|nr:hypothetical protein [Deltaproteobacteria bacterium]